MEKHCFKEVIVSTPEDLIKFLRESKSRKHKYYYRGQNSNSDKLETKIRRGQGSLANEDALEEYEIKMIEDYQRKVHHYIKDVPEEDEYLEWLSIVQHYGGSSRLLDFTHSLFIALYFSLHNNRKNDANVWVVSDLSMFYEEVEERYKTYLNDDEIFDYDVLHHCKLIKPSRDGCMTRKGSLPRKKELCKKWIYDCDNKEFRINKDFVQLVVKGKITKLGVFMIEPFRLNQRMIAQQGVFAVPFTLCVSFEENLCAMFGKDFKITENNNPEKLSEVDIDKLINECPLMEFTIKQESFGDFKDLLQDMNIKTETLFPDFEGLTQSLQEKIPILPDMP